MSCQFAVPIGRTGQAVERMVGDIQFHDAAPDVGELLVLRRDLHSGGNRSRARRGQSLHALDLNQAKTAGAEGFQLLVAHNFGIFTSDSAAARMTEVPAGTVISWPSMVRVTSSALSRFGVPKSCSTMDNMVCPRIPSTDGAGCLYGFDEIFGKMVQRRDHGVGRQAPQRAQRAVSQGFTQVAQDGLLLGRVFAGDQPVDDFHPRVEPMRQGVHLPQDSMAQNSIA